MNSTPDPTRDALYAAILAHPDEDTPRLVYADHIEENGDSARAEFIRLQCRLATMNDWDDDYTAADVRCHRLIAEHPQWHQDLGFGDSNLWSGDSMFRRGFAENFGFAGSWFRSHFETMFDRFPVRMAAVRANKNDDLPVSYLAKCAALGRLRRLVLDLDSDAVGELGTVPHLSNLESLQVGVYEARVSPLKALVESPHLRNLRSFAFRYVGHSAELPEPGARWDWFPHLRELQLSLYSLGDYYARLFDTGAWRRLERLSIPAGHGDGGRSILTALTGSRLPNLTDLAVNRVQVGPSALAPLLGLDRPPLRCLRLPHLQPYYAVRPRDVADGVFHSPWLHDLRRLELTSANLLDAWLTSVADAPMAKSLRALDLAGAGFDARAYRTAFGPKRKWPNLRRLNLWFTKCPEEVLTALVDHPGLRNLISLTARPREPAPTFLTRLAESPASARFRELNLHVKMDDATAAALLKSPHLENIDLLKVIKGTAGRTACNRLNRRFGARLTIEPNR